MSNMSYCRFQNTKLDLQDCIDGLVDDGLENLSPEEKQAADCIYELCKEFIDQYEEQQENEDDEQDDDPEYYNMIDRSDMYRDYKMSQRD